MAKIEFRGIKNSNDGKILVQVKVEHNDTIYDWEVVAPEGVEFQEYLDSKLSSIVEEIDEKENLFKDIKDSDISRETFVSPDIVPIKVSMAQARMVLIGAGLLDSIESFISSIKDPIEQKIIQTRWEYSTEVNRYDLLVLTLAQVLNLSDRQIDKLFIEASKL